MTYNHPDPLFETMRMYEDMLLFEYRVNGNSMKVKVLCAYLETLYKLAMWVYGGRSPDTQTGEG